MFCRGCSTLGLMASEVLAVCHFCSPLAIAIFDGENEDSDGK